MFFLTRSYSSQLFLQKQIQIYIHSKWCCLDAMETSSTCFTFVCVLKTLSLCIIPTCWSFMVGWQSGATQANTLKREFPYNGISCTNASNIEQRSIFSNNHLGGKQNNKHFNTPPKKIEQQVYPWKPWWGVVQDEISPFLPFEFIGFSEVVAQPCCTLHHSSVAWVVFAEVFDGERLRKKPV